MCGLSVLKMVTQVVVPEKNFENSLGKKSAIKNSNLTDVYLSSHRPALRNTRRRHEGKIIPDLRKFEKFLIKIRKAEFHFNIL